jgi:hypothetical protein
VQLHGEAPGRLAPAAASIEHAAQSSYIEISDSPELSQVLDRHLASRLASHGNLRSVYVAAIPQAMLLGQRPCVKGPARDGQTVF